jgi:hypothetical protein
VCHYANAGIHVTVPASAIAILLLALVFGAAIAVGEPLLAAPLAFVILVIWGGERVATARGRV